MDDEEELIMELETYDFDPHHGNTEAKSLSKSSKLKKYCCITIVIYLVLLITAAIVLLILLIYFVGGQPPRVETACGTLQGFYIIGSNVFSFKGVPYAVPPVGKLRWKSPEALSLKEGTCDNTIHEVTSFGSQCPQLDTNDENNVVGSEDCLYLNIYTPTINVLDKELPVLVFIHSGGLLSGNSSMSDKTPDEVLASSLNAVVVSIQYRLGALGFLTLDYLEDDGVNVGLLDQILALKWIKLNIAGFRGDSSNILLIGQGAGASSILALMRSPKSLNLFSKAWLMSPSPRLEDTKQEASQQNQYFLDKTECFNESCNTSKCVQECLRQLSYDNVVKFYRDESHPIWEGFDLPSKNFYRKAPLLVVDGSVIKDSYDRRYNLPDIPVVIGSTAQETDVFPAHRELFDLKNSTYFRLVKNSLDSIRSGLANESIRQYPFKNDVEYSLTTMASDIAVTCACNSIAEDLSNVLTVPVFRYVVSYSPSSSSNIIKEFDARYAYHGIDLFSFLDSYSNFMMYDPNKNDIHFARNLRNHIENFLKSSLPDEQKWPPFRNKTLIYDNEIFLLDRYNEKECLFWNYKEMLTYSWQN